MIGTRMSAKDRILLAKQVIESCSFEDLDLLYEEIKGEECDSNKKAYLVIKWTLGKIDIMVCNSWTDIIKREVFHHTRYLGAVYSNGDYKVVILDTSLYLGLSWPFSSIPLALAKYNDRTNKITGWRLKVGR